MPCYAMPCHLFISSIHSIPLDSLVHFQLFFTSYSIYIFISFDIDTLDPAFVPGTGTPEPGGLLPREAFPIVRRLCAESNVVGFELVELAPMLDPTYVSAMNANRLIRECMTGIAMRKKGLTDKHYLSPLTADDARD